MLLGNQLDALWASCRNQQIRTNPPIVSTHSNFIWSGVVRVVFVRKFVHLTTYFFTAVDIVFAESVRGVSWSLLATVPKRKSRRSLDMNLLWNSGGGRLEGLEEEQRNGEEKEKGEENNHHTTHR